MPSPVRDVEIVKEDHSCTAPLLAKPVDFDTLPARIRWLVEGKSPGRLFVRTIQVRSYSTHYIPPNGDQRLHSRTRPNCASGGMARCAGGTPAQEPGSTADNRISTCWKTVCQVSDFLLSRVWSDPRGQSALVVQILDPELQSLR